MNNSHKVSPGPPERRISELHIESLRQQGGFFVEAVRLTPMPMLVTDARLPGNPILFANDALINLSGYSRDELLGQDPSFMNGEDMDPEATLIDRMPFLCKRNEPLEILQYRKDGSKFRAMLFVSPLTDENGSVTNYFLSYLDITRRYDAEEKLRALTSQLEGRVAARTRELEVANEKLAATAAEAQAAGSVKADFLAMMSHELRTPLSAIIGFSRLLVEAELEGEQKEWASIVSDAGSSLLVVVDDVLDFSKIEAGKLTFDVAPFALRELAEGCGRLMAQSAGEKGLTLETRIPPSLPAWVLGDQQRLRQILLNFLNNAVKFTDFGGIVLAIETPGKRADGVHLIRFLVSDTGVGIASDKKDLLFHKFSMVDESRTRRRAGTGLGLAISKHLVELMQGTIGYTSEPGVGSTFWFEVPLPATGVPDDEVFRARPVSPGRQAGRILLAEDMRMNQILATKMLRRAGYDVDVVEDGAAAVTAVRNNVYDLVLMDGQMPIMDGVEATREIRNLPGGAGKVPIIALSASVLERQVQRFRAAGMDDHIGKPLDENDLLRAITRWFPNPPPAHLGDPIATSSVVPVSVFDRRAFDRLTRSMTPELSREILQILLKELRAFLTLMDRNPPDRQQLANQAHRLIGSTGMLGMTELFQLLPTCEEACLGDVAIDDALSNAREAGWRGVRALEAQLAGESSLS